MIPARLLLSLASSVLSEHVPNVHDAFSSTPGSAFDAALSNGRPNVHTFAKREVERGTATFVVFACLIPVLVILSGVFAGLTLGYMSLDETQLNVLSISGTPIQREYANKIKPIRKNGHLLLVTLLLANMIVNESLPLIAEPVLGGGVQSVIVSTVLIVLFAEIIPQSVCTRHGLYIGAKMAGWVRILIFGFGIISWPVAKLLEFILGPHHGIIYRRAELKELIAMHASQKPLGGDLRTDTVTIIGATLDSQDKHARHAMTPIDRVFMLHIDAKLDYDTLRRICATGHSRIPVYEEVELNVPAHVAIAAFEMGCGDGGAYKSPSSTKRSLDSGDHSVKTKVKKIIGILLVKQCVLLDPEDAVPVRKMRLNKVPFVPQNEPLLGILDRFQEGRSHMAIVSRLSVERAQSVKKAVKKGLTQRLLGAVRGDSSSSDSSSDDSDDEEARQAAAADIKDKRNDDKLEVDGDGDSVSVKDEKEKAKPSKGAKRRRKHFRRGSGRDDLEKGDVDAEAKRVREKEKSLRTTGLEQSMPADAVLSKENAEEYLATQGIDPAIMPMGIITLEDVLEELIGEEIYDEFDAEGMGAHSQSFVPPGAHPKQQAMNLVKKNSAPELAGGAKKEYATGKVVADAFPAIGGSLTPPAPSFTATRSLGLAMPRPIAIPSLKNLGFLRSRSAPPTPRDTNRPSSSATASPPSVPTPVQATASGSETMAPSTVGTSVDSTSHPPTFSSTSPEGDTRPLTQIIENPSPGESTSSYTGDRVHSKLASEPGVPTASKASPGFPFQTSGTATTPRSNSPAPSLEALLLERKRRAQMNASGGAGPPSPTAGPILTGVGGKVKGTFKSSPLSPASPSNDT